jgi:hypothetical protein
MALHPRLMTSPPIARRPMTRIVTPWREWRFSHVGPARSGT